VTAKVPGELILKLEGHANPVVAVPELTLTTTSEVAREENAAGLKVCSAHVFANTVVGVILALTCLKLLKLWLPRPAADVDPGAEPVECVIGESGLGQPVGVSKR
jgi:hypothetical protein